MCSWATTSAHESNTVRCKDMSSLNQTWITGVCEQRQASLRMPWHLWKMTLVGLLLVRGISGNWTFRNCVKAALTRAWWFFNCGLLSHRVRPWCWWHMLTYWTKWFKEINADVVAERNGWTKYDYSIHTMDQCGIFFGERINQPAKCSNYLGPSYFYDVNLLDTRACILTFEGQGFINVLSVRLYTSFIRRVNLKCPAGFLNAGFQHRQHRL
jgi:hypothetical protein